jgi:hypothetical protein
MHRRWKECTTTTVESFVARPILGKLRPVETDKVSHWLPSTADMSSNQFSVIVRTRMVLILVHSRDDRAKDFAFLWSPTDYRLLRG